jgi:hypothetical protein
MLLFGKRYRQNWSQFAYKSLVISQLNNRINGLDCQFRLDKLTVYLI